MVDEADNALKVLSMHRNTGKADESSLVWASEKCGLRWTPTITSTKDGKCYKLNCNRKVTKKSINVSTTTLQKRFCDECGADHDRQTYSTL